MQRRRRSGSHLRASAGSEGSGSSGPPRSDGEASASGSVGESSPGRSSRGASADESAASREGARSLRSADEGASSGQASPRRTARRASSRRRVSRSIQFAPKVRLEAGRTVRVVLSGLRGASQSVRSASRLQLRARIEDEAEATTAEFEAEDLDASLTLALGAAVEKEDAGVTLTLLRRGRGGETKVLGEASIPLTAPLWHAEGVVQLTKARVLGKERVAAEVTVRLIMGGAGAPGGAEKRDEGEREGAEGQEGGQEAQREQEGAQEEKRREGQEEREEEGQGTPPEQGGQEGPQDGGGRGAGGTREEEDRGPGSPKEEGALGRPLRTEEQEGAHQGPKDEQEDDRQGPKGEQEDDRQVPNDHPGRARRSPKAHQERAHRPPAQKKDGAPQRRREDQGQGPHDPKEGAAAGPERHQEGPERHQEGPAHAPPSPEGEPTEEPDAARPSPQAAAPQDASPPEDRPSAVLRRDAAAVVLQKAYRGRRARLDASVRRDFRALASQDALLQLSNTLEGSRADRRAAQAASFRASRSRRARALLRRRPSPSAVPRLKERGAEAIATALQSLWRGSAARRRLERLRFMAVEAQRAVRGHLARLKCRRLRVAAREELSHRQARARRRDALRAHEEELRRLRRGRAELFGDLGVGGGGGGAKGVPPPDPPLMDSDGRVRYAVPEGEVESLAALREALAARPGAHPPASGSAGRDPARRLAQLRARVAHRAARRCGGGGGAAERYERILELRRESDALLRRRRDEGDAGVTARRRRVARCEAALAAAAAGGEAADKGGGSGGSGGEAADKKRGSGSESAGKGEGSEAVGRSAGSEDAWKVRREIREAALRAHEAQMAALRSDAWWAVALPEDATTAPVDLRRIVPSNGSLGPDECSMWWFAACRKAARPLEAPRGNLPEEIRRILPEPSRVAAILYDRVRIGPHGRRHRAHAAVDADLRAVEDRAERLAAMAAHLARLKDSAEEHSTLEAAAAERRRAAATAIQRRLRGTLARKATRRLRQERRIAGALAVLLAEVGDGGAAGAVDVDSIVAAWRAAGGRAPRGEGAGYVSPPSEGPDEPGAEAEEEAQEPPARGE